MPLNLVAILGFDLNKGKIGMLEFADRFRLGRNGLIPVQVQVLLPINVIEAKRI